MKKLMCAIMMAAAATTALAADVAISYQGQLMDGAGHVLQGVTSKQIQFRIYEQQTGGTALWGRQSVISLDANGYFNIELGDNTGSPITGETSSHLADILAKAQTKTFFLGLTVLSVGGTPESTGEIVPRQKLLAVPVSAFALDVDEAKGKFSVCGEATVHGDLVANSNLTVKGTTKLEGTTTLSGTTKLKGSVGLGSFKDFSTDDGAGLVPERAILMWSGPANDIPKGWALCDGDHGTPDLRGRFIVGASPNREHKDVDIGYARGDHGGESFHKLNANELPKHTHPTTLRSHVIYTYSQSDIGGRYVWADTGWDGNNSPKDIRYAFDNETSELAHENRPPYYALCFIMKIKE